MSAYVSGDLRRKVREHFVDRCAYCQTAERLSAATFEVKHIQPRSASGETVFENLCLACPMCNRFKGDRTTTVDPITGEAASLFHPHRDSWTDYFEWNGAATEVIPLTPVGRATAVLLRMNRPQMVRLRRMWVALGEHPPEVP